jgi:hypothetical protein
VNDERPRPDAEELEDLGLSDPSAPDSHDRLELIHYVMALGATVDDVGASTDLEELATDISLRPRGSSTLGEVAEAVGLQLDDAQRFCTALGLSNDPDKLMTADEAETVRLLAVRRQGPAR